jgi:hypothetical protein
VDLETRAYLDELRHEMNRRFDRVDGRLDGVDARLDSVDAQLTTMDAELRRHFGVLIEHVRHENQIGAEMVVANTEAIARLRRRLDVR